jgi:hypothetical protein
MKTLSIKSQIRILEETIMKGILFTEPMFHKVVSGEKTQDRQIIKPQPVTDIFPAIQIDDFWTPIYPREQEYYYAKRTGVFVDEDGDRMWLSRYRIGETVYLKEPYYYESEAYGFTLPEPIIHYKFGAEWKRFPWENKLFMPAKYARYFIEITGVRVERLQISDEDYGLRGTWLRNPYVFVYDFKLIK